MSDPQFGERDPERREPTYGEPGYGEPVEETTDGATPAVDDVVGSANDSLAEAEAASRNTERQRGDSSFEFEDRGSDLSIDYGKYSDDDSAASASAVSSEPLYRPSVDEPAGDTTAEPAADTTPDEKSDTTAATAAPATVAYAHDATPTAVAPATVTPSEPVAERASSSEQKTDAATPPAAYTQQPIFVQAPEAPRPRGNRGAAGAIGLLAALVFAILFLGANLGVAATVDGLALDEVADAALNTLMTWAFWVPVAVFFLGFWLLGAFINRGRWGLWVVFGLIVGAFSYGGYLLGQLFEAPFWTIAPSEAGTLVSEQLFAPLAVIAFVLGREITIWFGAWVAARGRRVTELNAEAQREYERTLEAGPQLHQY
ncbi:ABC transporter [Microbacterium sp.]|uniref:ABC transporter n=1 Tax=Microbacterium sp. TaxID=51671 RepID=UPI00373560F5